MFLMKYNHNVRILFYFFQNNYHNIIIKYGRYIPNDGKHFDRVLGVELVSNNQYAIKYE